MNLQQNVGMEAEMLSVKRAGDSGWVWVYVCYLNKYCVVCVDDVTDGLQTEDTSYLLRSNLMLVQHFMILRYTDIVYTVNTRMLFPEKREIEFS